MAEEKKYLGTAAVERLIANTRSEIEAAKNAANSYADSLADNYDAAGTAQTKVDALADGQVKTNTEHIGTMDKLETAAKSDLVTAINEVRNAVSVGGTAAALTMEEKSTGLGDGVLKAYVLKQGENTVGTINIPKDMVVQSGEVVVNPEGQAAGTYIKLVLANATNDVIYVNVGNLVDIYKAKANAAQVQIAIDSATREVSASIVADSISSTELAANAVVTAKIADGNVTKAKLSSEVQTSLDKADKALDDAKDYADGLNNNMNTRVEALEAIDHDHTNKTVLDSYDKTQTELLAAAKAEHEERIVELEKVDHDHSNKALLDTYTQTEADLADAVAKKHEHANATQLATYDKTQTELLAAAKAEHEDRIIALESVTYVEITASEIDAMFAAE